ncbi:MAG: VWA domain-containing protein [Spirochaetota bacterium]|nr:VWA domain-containing protein [Spirochaetota bacterium]
MSRKRYIYSLLFLTKLFIIFNIISCSAESAVKTRTPSVKAPKPSVYSESGSGKDVFAEELSSSKRSYKGKKRLKRKAKYKSSRKYKRARKAKRRKSTYKRSSGARPEKKYRRGKARLKKKYGGDKARPASTFDSKPRTKAARIRRSSPSSSGLRAGFVDDNKQFNYFLSFLAKYRSRADFYPMNIQERIQIKLKDKKGKSLPNCELIIKNSDGRVVSKGKTYADGSYLFFPGAGSGQSSSYEVTGNYRGKSRTVRVKRQGRRVVNIRFPVARKAYKRVPLDIVFILDTTGSMGEEIQRLKDTIDIIHMNVSNFSSRPDVRFGMVLYKDQGDEYRTRVVQLTSDIDEFKDQLDQVFAGGGGDGPEDLQEALRVAMKDIKWRESGIRLAFTITDATAHLDYGQQYTYVSAAKEAKSRAIKLFSIGTGGLDIRGEYILRQLAQFTSANYIFLHYGEQGESEGGRIGSVSHHTGSNYKVSTLESLVISLTKKELSHLTRKPIRDGQEYFIAKKVTHETSKETFSQLFSKAVKQLSDYSSYHLDNDIPTTVMPVYTKKKSLKGDAEFYTDELALTLSRQKTFKLVDRENIQKLIQEQALQSSDLFNEKKSVKIGKLVGAKLMIISKLYYRKGKHIIILKLVRVETGEILSASKVRIDKNLRS